MNDDPILGLRDITDVMERRFHEPDPTRRVGISTCGRAKWDTNQVELAAAIVRAAIDVETKGLL